MNSDTLGRSAGVVSEHTPAVAERVADTSRRFEAIVLALYALLVSVVESLHEPWKDETQSWRLAIDSDGLAALVHNSRYEGHPLLFHVLMQAVGHLSRSWWAAAALHVVIACIAAWLVLRYAPFTRLQKVLLVFGYWSVYEYSVVVRPYGPGMMFAFAACAAWCATPRRIGWAVVALALTANTTVMGTLLAMTLALAFAIDWAWPDGGAPRPSQRTVIRAGLLAGVALLAVLWLAAAQIAPPADAAYKGEPTSLSGISRWDIGRIPTVELRALFPFTAYQDGTVLWSRWLFAPVSARDLALLLVASAIMLAIGLLIAARRRVALIVYLVGTIGYLLFFAFFFPGSAHHHGYLFLVWVISAWLAWAGPPSDRPRVLRALSAPAEGIVRRLFTLSLVLPVVAGIEIVAADVLTTFSDARHTAAVIRQQGLADVPIIGLVRSHAQSVSAFLDRKVLYPVEGKTLSFVEWGQGAGYHKSVAAVDSASAALLTRECRVLVITAAGQEVSESTARRGHVIYTTPKKPMSGDRFRVWLLTAPPSPRCARARS
jgi:hypothetical protein